MEIFSNVIILTTTDWILFIVWSCLLSFLPVFLFFSVPQWINEYVLGNEDKSSESLIITKETPLERESSSENPSVLNPSTPNSEVVDDQPESEAALQAEPSSEFSVEDETSNAKSSSNSSTSESDDTDQSDNEEALNAESQNLREFLPEFFMSPYDIPFDEPIPEFDWPPNATEEEKLELLRERRKYMRELERKCKAEGKNDKVYWKRIKIGSIEGGIPVIRPFNHGKTFEPVYPSDLSLESCEGDPNSRYIQFTSHVVLENGFACLRSAGSIIQTESIPLYFNHVLYSFKLVVETNNDTEFDFKLYCDVGPHLSENGVKRDKWKAVVDNVNPENDIKELKPPNLLCVEMILYDNKEEKKEKITLHRRKNFPHIFETPKSITKSQLLLSSRRDPEENSLDFHCELLLYVERDYFSIERLLKDHAPPAASNYSTQKKVQRILNGERVDNATWTLTVDAKEERVGGINEFYVEESKLQADGSRFKKLLKTGKSDEVLTLNKKKREIRLRNFNTEDLQMVIPVLYGEKCPYPKSRKSDVVLGKLFGLFEANAVRTIATGWEHEIIRRALAVDPLIDSVDSFIEIISLLTIVFYFPRGMMPLAKRVAIGVLADMMYLHVPRGNFLNYPDLIFMKIYEHDLDLTQCQDFHAILHSAMLHKYKVRSVRKRGLNTLPE